MNLPADRTENESFLASSRVAEPTARLKLTVTVVVLLIIGGVIFFMRRVPTQQWRPSNALEAAAPPEISDDVDLASLQRAIEESLAWCARQDHERVLSYGPTPVGVGELKATLDDFKAHLTTLGLTPAFYAYVRENYSFFSSAAPEVLFTGYFEARLRGSLTRTDTFSYPLYRRPEDLVVVDLAAWSWLDRIGLELPKTLRARITPERRVVPYYSRAEIDYSGALAGRGLEAVWVDDPIEAFFLHIQGSGVITLPDGTTQRVGYAEKNGHPYRPIGKLLIDRNVLAAKDVSAQTIKGYLRQNPDQQRDIFTFNPSYVFFDLRERGPTGSLGTIVTGNRSIATDSALFPHGGLAYIETEKPRFDSNGTVVGWEKFGRFVLNQDTGGAITGPARVDIFTGFGDDAEDTAGVMKQRGRLFFLVKKRTR